MVKNFLKSQGITKERTIEQYMDGINPEGNQHGTDIRLPKIINTYQAQRPVEMLRSTANPMLDAWSVPEKPFQTEGGGIQWFNTNKGAWEKIK